MGGVFCEDDFAGGADVGFEQVAAVGGAVLFAYDYVGVDLGLVVFEGYVADEGEEFYLLVEVYGGLVFFGFPVEPG